MLTKITPNMVSEVTEKIKVLGSRLTVLKIFREKGSGTLATCKCSCGKMKTSSLHLVKTAKLKSCGCLEDESRSLTWQKMRKHGYATASSVSSEYHCWCGIKSRCYNSKMNNFYRYGGRGIGMCERWRNSFESFIADMGPKPSKTHTIERIDNDGDYCPDNCRWATWDEQRQNKQNTKRVIYKGDEVTLRELSEITGLDRNLLWKRIFKLNWSVEKAATKSPVRIAKPTK